jgi:hypothetical protein
MFIPHPDLRRISAGGAVWTQARDHLVNIQEPSGTMPLYIIPRETAPLSSGRFECRQGQFTYRTTRSARVSLRSTHGTASLSCSKHRRHSISLYLQWPTSLNRLHLQMCAQQTWSSIAECAVSPQK